MLHRRNPILKDATCRHGQMANGWRHNTEYYTTITDDMPKRAKRMVDEAMLSCMSGNVNSGISPKEHDATTA